MNKMGLAHTTTSMFIRLKDAITVLVPPITSKISRDV